MAGARLAIQGGRTLEGRRAEVADGLRARRSQIEQAVLTRCQSLAEPAGDLDPRYLDDLRRAVEEAIEYGLANVEGGEAGARPVPGSLLLQARLAARARISIDTVMRYCFAGFTLFGDFVLEEAAACAADPAEARTLMREQSVLFERFLDAIGREHADEQKSLGSTTDRRLAQRVQSLLDGELVDMNGLGYDFGGHHVAAIAAGDGAEETVRRMASELDRRLLLVRPAKGVVWAWFGGSRELRLGDLRKLADRPAATGLAISLGEPSVGLTGWRLTHRQAKAALPIALRRGAVVSYAGVALLAAAVKDDLLSASLRDVYLRPLEEERDGGETARRTLRAYFAAERNVSSAAAALGVSRRTVANRLRSIEARLGRPLKSAMAEIEAALQFEDLGQVA
ncbi:MAG TPA: helix-turn-helix domain-containing protein [Solirubrobacterales bacterium]|nr:helix-turn-helix domain-containing protein [Solirubrobacterales bacterium]